MTEKSGLFASSRMLLGSLLLVIALIVAAFAGYYVMKGMYRASEMRGARWEPRLDRSMFASGSARGLTERRGGSREPG